MREPDKVVIAIKWFLYFVMMMLGVASFYSDPNNLVGTIIGATVVSILMVILPKGPPYDFVVIAIDAFLFFVMMMAGYYGASALGSNYIGVFVSSVIGSFMIALLEGSIRSGE